MIVRPNDRTFGGHESFRVVPAETIQELDGEVRVDVGVDLTDELVSHATPSALRLSLPAASGPVSLARCSSIPFPHNIEEPTRTDICDLCEPGLVSPTTRVTRRRLVQPIASTRSIREGGSVAHRRFHDCRIHRGAHRGARHRRGLRACGRVCRSPHPCTVDPPEGWDARPDRSCSQPNAACPDRIIPPNLDGPTAEDPSITDSAERHRLFGEPSHVRPTVSTHRIDLSKPGWG